MRNLLVLLMSISLGACAMNATDEDPSQSASASEPNEQRAGEYIVLGYCALDASHHKTGWCIGGTNLCSHMSMPSSCVPGSAGVTPHDYLSCTAVAFDQGSRCMMNAQ